MGRGQRRSVPQKEICVSSVEFCGSPWLVSAGVARTEQLAAAYAAKAVGAIRRLEPSEPRAALIALTQQVLTRSK